LSVFTTVSEGRLVLHLSICITWCDVTPVYSFKVIEYKKLLDSIPMHVILVILYVLQILCDISLTIFVTYIKPWWLRYVTYSFTCCLSVFETWLLILRKEYWLRAFKNIVVRKLNSNSEEIMEQWVELRTSYLNVFTKWCLCSSESG